jgi:hypothetical protein
VFLCHAPHLATTTSRMIACTYHTYDDTKHDNDDGDSPAASLNLPDLYVHLQHTIIAAACT